MRQTLRLLYILAVALLLSLSAATEVHAQKKTLRERIINFLDSSNVKGTDPQYIALPEKKWRVILSTSTDQQYMKMDSHLEAPEAELEDDQTVDFGMKIKQPVANAIGLWAGYRGWGAGYSVATSGIKGINMSFNIATPSNGVNIRIHRYKFDRPESYLSMKSSDFEMEGYLTDGSEAMESPINIESFVFDGYWIFNKKRFSLAAAYDQSVLQLRSAGSFIAGLMFYYQKFDYADPSNFLFIECTNRIGKLKVYQGSLGIGYTYNWVPLKHLTLNAVVMPVVSLFNHVDSYYYNIDDEWYETDDFEDYPEMTFNKRRGTNGHIRLNIDARLAVSYWIGNWFMSAIAQMHSFDSKYDNVDMKMSDWNIKGSVGVTF